MSDTLQLHPYSEDVKQAINNSLRTANEMGHGNATVWHLMYFLASAETDAKYTAKTNEIAPLSDIRTKALLNVESFLRYLENELNKLPRNQSQFDDIFTPSKKQPAALDEQMYNVLLAAVARHAALNPRQQGQSGVVTSKELWAELIEDPNVGRAFSTSGLDRARWNNLRNLWNPSFSAESDIGFEADTNPLDPSSMLAQFCTDLTDEVRKGRIDPVVGRDDEMREAMNILQRRTQNNPVFVGDAGVGKTTLVNGLALRMVKNEVPETMKNKRLLSFDLIKISAGASRSELEKRVKGLIQEVESNPNIILFIDDIHQLVNVFGDGQVVGQLLKPALARGELRCIGATSPEEYRLHLEKDIALERRFQKVPVMEPSIEEAIAILRGIKESYSLHHGVDITDTALVSAVELSARYIADRSLPAKAIDLMDGAAARVRTTLDSKPERLERAERKLINLKVQREALKKEEVRVGGLDIDTTERLTELENDIQEVEQDAFAVEQQWTQEKDLHDVVNGIREELAEAHKNLTTAEANQDLVEMSHLQHGVIPELEKSLRTARRDVADIKNPLMHDQVEESQIAEVVARRTGIPVAKMTGDEQQKFAEMEHIIGEQVIGQDDAVVAISDSVRRSRAGLSDPNKPVGSFLFLGPTGVGKTELTKQLSTFLFERKDAMVRVDMSEFMEKHTVSRLIGAPPGYAGYEEGGMLTEAIRAHPYSVILLDEVEKAHPDVFNILLQVLDDGRLTDGKGRTVDFKNTVIIMTSNLGASEIQSLTAEGADQETIKDAVMEHVKGHFRPEFINRLDETVLFRPLGKEAIANIAKLLTKKVVKRVQDQKIDLTITSAAMDHLAEAGFDPLMGARPLKRALQNELENPLSKKIICGHVKEGDRLVVNAVEGKLTWDVLEPAAQFDSDEDLSVSPSSVAQKATTRRKPVTAKKKTPA